MQPASSEQTSSLIRRGLVVAGIIVIGLLTALPLFGDIPNLVDAFREFNWWLIAPVVALTVWNFSLRFIKMASLYPCTWR